jgi:hypothetical protein
MNTSMQSPLSPSCSQTESFHLPTAESEFLKTPQLARAMNYKKQRSHYNSTTSQCGSPATEVTNFNFSYMQHICGSPVIMKKFNLKTMRGLQIFYKSYALSNNSNNKYPIMIEITLISI